MWFGALSVTVRFIIEEPAGVYDTSHQHSWRQLRQLTAHPVQIYQNTRTASARKKTFYFRASCGN